MTILDTDTFSLLMYGHLRVSEKMSQTQDVYITIVTRIEVLQGRFASILKAANETELMRAQDRLEENERFIRRMTVISFNDTAAAEFEGLRQNSKLKKVGRADLLIASIALGCRATLATRNLKHFRLVPGLKVENWAD